MSASMRFFRGLLTIVGIALTVGCASFDLKSPKTWFPPDDNKPQAPSSVTAIWSPALLQRGDGSQARGFGGRLMFYGTKGHSPICVDGSLVVYAFDDVGNTQNARPSRKYVFTREQFCTHHSKSDLGHSYSVWIPWDRAQADAKQVSLIVRFSPVEGSAIVSEQAKATLPGSNASPIEQLPTWASPPPQSTSPAQPASYDVTAAPQGVQEAGSPQPNRRIATTTISLPSRAEQR